MTVLPEDQALSVLERMHRALNAHDIDAFVELFSPEYRSEQPAHPDRQFGGREQVRENWGGTFQEVPDFRADLLRSAVSRAPSGANGHGPARARTIAGWRCAGLC